MPWEMCQSLVMSSPAPCLSVHTALGATSFPSSLSGGCKQLEVKHSVQVITASSVTRPGAVRTFHCEWQEPSWHFLKQEEMCSKDAGGASGLREEKEAEEVQRLNPGLYAAGLPFFPSIPASACIPMVGGLRGGPTITPVQSLSLECELDWFPSNDYNMEEAMGCYFQGEVMKRLCTPVECSLALAGPVGNQLPCQGAAPWRGPCGQGPRSANNPRRGLEGGSPQWSPQKSSQL